MKINIGDSWKEVAAVKINIGDVWKDVVDIKQNIGDVWKDTGFVTTTTTTLVPTTTTTTLVPTTTTTTSTTQAPQELTFSFTSWYSSGEGGDLELPVGCTPYHDYTNYVIILPTGSTFGNNTGGTLGYFYYNISGEWYPTDCRDGLKPYTLHGTGGGSGTTHRFIWEASTTPQYYGNTKTSSQYPYDRYNSGYYYLDFTSPI